MPSDDQQIETAHKSSEQRRKVIAWLTVGAFGGLATCLMTIAWPFIVPAFRKVVLPYVPATPLQIENVLKAIAHKQRRPPTTSTITTAQEANAAKEAAAQAAKAANSASNQKDLKLIDLGSGDGRIVIACAQQGFRCDGVELNPWLVLYSKYRAFRLNVHKQASFKRKNLFKVDLAEYDKIILFGVESMMSLIEHKIRQDCDNGNKQVELIVCRFPLPHWKPLMTFGSGVDQVWLYEYHPSSNHSSGSRSNSNHCVNGSSESI